MYTMKECSSYPIKETEAVNLRRRILSDCGSDAYVLFLAYQEYHSEYDSMPSDIVVSNSFGWSASKVKRLRDKLYDATTNYYHLVILDND